MNFINLKGTCHTECFLLQFDGLAVPNPGQATGGAVLFAPRSTRIVFERGEYLSFATNNQAEYTGLIIGLESATKVGVKHICIEGDSMLVVKQVAGEWKMKHEGLKPYHTRAKELLTQFETVAIRHIPRNQNAHADRLTNETIDTKQSFYRV